MAFNPSDRGASIPNLNSLGMRNSFHTLNTVQETANKAAQRKAKEAQCSVEEVMPHIGLSISCGGKFFFFRFARAWFGWPRFALA
jgi:hypothetical protein